MINWYSWLRPLLFSLEPERAHQVALQLLTYCPKIFLPRVEMSGSVSFMGLSFPHRIGIAAGLDKNGNHINALGKLNPAFIEVGTITPLPQQGNPKPRLFRLREIDALINRMGFNSEGLLKFEDNVKKRAWGGILGINIGKNKNTPLTLAVRDYVTALEVVYPYASYVTVNISSPNTADLRLLQQKVWLEELLEALMNKQKDLSLCLGRKVPICLKISPDETDDVLKEMAALALKYEIAGIIAVNTTASRPLGNKLPLLKETGGLSGRPLLERAYQTIQLLKSEVGDAITLIGCGGVMDPSSAKLLYEAGASLLQVYTGLIYRGPFLIQELALALAKKPTTF